MNAMESSNRHAATNGLLGQAKVPELTDGDHTVLSGRDSGDRRVAVGHFPALHG